MKRKKRDPKVGTGKKPKGSGRRLYTDENPKDTVRIKFATTADARATVAKVKKIKKPFARKIQILTVGEQRAKVMGKKQVASIFKKGKFQPCGRKSAKGKSKRKYPKCVPRAKAKRMTAAQRKSAVRRKRAAGNPGGKPRNVRTIVKKRKTTRKRRKK